jgi:hypothetical protein
MVHLRPSRDSGRSNKRQVAMAMARAAWTVRVGVRLPAEDFLDRPAQGRSLPESHSSGSDRQDVPGQGWRPAHSSLAQAAWALRNWYPAVSSSPKSGSRPSCPPALLPRPGPLRSEAANDRRRAHVDGADRRFRRGGRLADGRAARILNTEAPPALPRFLHDGDLRGLAD